MEQFERIRRDARDEELSIRALADKYNVHRRTVRAALGDAVPPTRKTPGRAAPALGPHVDTIRGWLTADLDAPRKQRHTARRIWQRLLEEERAGLSQGELAEQVGLERTVVNKIEVGVRKVSALELSDMAAALKVRMASFFREPTPALVAHRTRQDPDTVDSKIDRLIEAMTSDVEFLESLAPQELGLIEAVATLEGADDGLATWIS